MLISFRVRNYRSIRDEKELTLVASPLQGGVMSIIPTKERIGVNLVKAAAIYGPNASGKTNMLRALSYMRLAVVHSHKDWSVDGPIPYFPFKLDPAFNGAPSAFEVDAIIGGVRYKYGFEQDSTSILSEWLYAYPNKVRQEWFRRSPGNQFEFKRRIAGRASLTKLTRTNSLFLSAAVQNGNEELVPVYNWFQRQVLFLRNETRELHRLHTLDRCKKPEYGEIIAKLLTMADLGIVGMDTADRDMAEHMKAYFQMADIIHAPPTTMKGQMIPSATLRHSTGSGDSVSLPLEDESDGTRAYLSLLGPLINQIENGGVLLVDELEASLHPIVARHIIELVNADENDNGAQLIFSTHDSTLLDPDLLRRDQIWFTEKDASGATDLYPLSDFKTRPNENLRRGYLQGRYGAIPFVGSSSLFRKIVEGESEAKS
ncbi:MAG: hypothetical protein JWQ98_2025 [Chlorobi bacterium]|nr:hypothetical protein [Chlorobiota bacterium]